MKKIRWGILSTARIGVEKVIPALHASTYGKVVAIASRSRHQAKIVGERLGIPGIHDSYDALLAASDVDAVYIPLPNHLHVPWSIRALEAGKHVLCEKPIGLNAAEACALLDTATRYPHLKVMEAFMYRFHPQWHQAKTLVEAGAIGRLRTVHTTFTYFNDDPNNVRNKPDIGGGGLMDIGCYAISVARYFFDKEPVRVCSLLDYDPQLQVDRLASALLDFGEETATFTCATQLAHHQRVELGGTQGRIEVLNPFNPPPDAATTIRLQQGRDVEELVIPPANQYTHQADVFAEAILNDTPVPTLLEDAVANMRTIDAVFESSQERRWVDVVPQ